MKRTIYCRAQPHSTYVEVDQEYMRSIWPDIDLDVDETTIKKRDGHLFKIVVEEIEAERSDR